MKKKYPIIQVGEFLYAVDKEKRPKDRHPCISYHKETEAPMFDEHYYEEDESYYVYKPSLIVATNNPSLKGVLELPPIEEDIPEYKADIPERLFMWWIDKEIQDAYKAGYKAAQAKGKYTEEDMRKAFKAGMHFGIDGMDNPGCNEYLKSLSKVPKAIEVEMEKPIKLRTESMGADELWSDPKPKSNNNIIVGKYIRE